MTMSCPQGLEFVKGSVDFPMEWANGRTVFVLEFWATWCGPCRSYIPHLSEMQRKFADLDVIFIGITKEDRETVSKFVQSMGSNLEYRVAIDKDDSVHQAFMGQYDIRGIPHVFVIGRGGKVQWHGHPSEDNFEAQLIAAAGKKPNEMSDVDIKRLSEKELHDMPVHDIKNFLSSKGVDYTGATEKSELIQMVRSC
eukprot:TRINITY_DN2401_c0_g1_i1.p2 TRINITY_DN2401_c0_g1~~TRINITY_DN2401_c0_g1_i1.p2  ORF type:complete len:196 (-),score=48.48 TRINITY_DN2401_c0_g1_i1:1192-1779(-)